MHYRVGSKVGRGGEFPSNHSIPSTAIKWKLCSFLYGGSLRSFSCASVLLPCESVHSWPATVPSPLLRKIYYIVISFLRKEKCYYEHYRKRVHQPASPQWTRLEAIPCSKLTKVTVSSAMQMIKPYTGPASFSLIRPLFTPSLLAQAAIFISLFVLYKPFVLLSKGLRQSQHEIRPPWLFLWLGLLCCQAQKLWCEKESPHSPKVWVQASHVLGCFPEMANSETAVRSSFLLQNLLSYHAIIILSCQDDASQTSLQNSDKQRRVHLSPSYGTRMPLGLCLCLCSLVELRASA